MIHDADLMSKDRDGEKYVLLKRTASGGIGGPVWMGGGVEDRSELTRVSEGDVVRVGMLYGGEVKGGEWAAAVRVRIGGRVDVVVPGRRRREGTRDEM